MLKFSPGAGFLWEDFISQSSSIYPDQGLSRDVVLWAGCDQVLRSAADLAGYPPEPSPPITRDLCLSSLPPLPSTLGSLTLRHRDSGVSPPPRTELQLPQVLERCSALPAMVPSFCPGSAWDKVSLHVGQGFVSPSPSQESCLCLVQGALLPWWAVSASSIHGSALSPFIPWSPRASPLLQACTKNKDVQTGRL